MVITNFNDSLNKTNTLILLVFLALLPNNLLSQTIEKAHLTTDKNLYAQEDTIWFKAYTFGRDNRLSDKSLSLKVVVSDTEGNKLKETSWPILQGMAEGYLVAPKDEGKYIIAAISGQMVGSSPEMAFTRSFFVRSELVDDVLLSAFLRSDPEHVSDSLVVDVYSRMNPTSPAPDYRFSYELWSGENRLDRGNERTNGDGEFRLKLTDIPTNLSSYRLIIKSNEGNRQGDYQFTLPIESVPSPIDLQFFPEGGQLVAGVPNRVAFKAMKSSERPVDIKAVLLNESGQVLDTITSYYQGMGSFNLIPNHEPLRVRIIEPFQIDSLYSLPSTLNEGLSLSLVQGQENQPLIRLIPSTNYKAEQVNISIQQFDQVVHSFQAFVNHRQFFELHMDNLSPGVASVKISGPSGEPLAERLFFAKPDSRVNVKLTTDKKEYAPREEVVANIEVLDEDGLPVAGSFSFSAIDIDRSISPVDDQPKLMAQILLKSELKGFIPTPNFYFSGHVMAAEALDLVMLTNGWRRFVPSRFEDAEGIEGFIIRNNNKRKIITDKKIKITDLEAFVQKDVQVEGEGFYIPSSYFKYKGDSFLITADQEGARDKFSIRISDSSRLAAIELFKSVVENRKQFNANQALYQLPFKLREDRFNNTLILSTVIVQSNRNTEEICELQDYHFEKPWITKMAGELDLTRASIQALLLQMGRQVVGFGDVKLISIRAGASKILAVDALLSNEKTLGGVPIPFRVFINCDEIPVIPSYNFTIPPDMQILKTLEQISFSNLAAISVKRGSYDERPILIIHTQDDKVIYKPTFEKFKILRAYTDYSREFYSPAFDTPEKVNDQVPDLRTTIFWQASVVTDENGKAQVRFYNADRPNKIQINVEGVDTYSNIGFTQTSYQVVER